ncbi:hypothetical protein ILUMI_15736 [Ignelater luminosus]|uniref:DUF4817 domain-containing protein n=1 Tax=Ignelater luminosus TaxID=2038154 RepID=A0A8K0CU71_IGNLU|nr:hypothetical protein ILUMI_15736 [Ignelater luminosus]
MEQWSGEQRAFVVKSYYKNNCVVADQRHFRTYFQIRRHGRVPLAHAIKEWVCKFEQTGSANNVKHKGPKKSVRTPENIDRVRASVEPSPKRSIRIRAQARTSIYPAIPINRVAVIGENPQVLHEQPLHSPKVTVWCAMSSMGIIGSLVFEDENENAVTVNSVLYTDMINQFLNQHLNTFPQNNRTWLQQHDATSHTTRASLDSLQRLFPRHIISRRGNIKWLARLAITFFFGAT